eukprot:CAMPEP_0114426426 /NCGR_PEP_ID=MMETSP0103-20121206/7794_1 /TAXON_ID=37642 ORGANISM="Paraphysomonas imperforata, Strain PA2" /NCGR_SAMPLE_ID=MMETSP0103 /ASSEMBLY_ACC=CAM_ASM_000201 /LENGTH=606 /DNA_ID=CAMNT_0001595391 /DNA_START=421 /DNA_END=2241 /DNA_ORIENTATION=-
MKGSEEIPFDAVLEFVIYVGANIIFSVHSTWSAAIVWFTHSAVLLYTTVGSSPVQYLHAFILCLIVAIVSFMAEVHQLESYKSYVDKHNLMVQLAHKTEEMRALIGNVAHDLKTPLQAFVSELESISDDDADTRDSLRGISDFMLMMINRSIEFTKVQSGHRLKPSMESVNISSCVDWVVTTISHSGKAENVTISTEYDLQGAAEWVITDKHWLLENLLCYMSNAVKFVSDGSITIKVSADFNDSENNQHFNNGQHDIENVSLQPASTASIIDKVRTKFSSPIAPEASSSESEVKYFQNGLKSKAHENVIIFSVIDTGVGISQDKMDGLFQPFFQAQKGAGGTGLGLYALSKRVEALGGEYGVRGRDDGAQGSCFWFSIPYRPDTELTEDSVVAYNHDIRRSHSVPSSQFKISSRRRTFSDANSEIESTEDGIVDDPKPVIEPPPPVMIPSAGMPRVLLVDDSHMIQKASTRALEKDGFHVTSAYNGVECLKQLKEARETGQHFDVVLLDLQMPVLDGFETIKRIREEEQLRDLESGLLDENEEDGGFPTSRALCNNGRRQYVIGLSANSDAESVDCVAAAGMDNFIAKPLRVSSLRKFCEPQIDF